MDGREQRARARLAVSRAPILVREVNANWWALTSGRAGRRQTTRRELYEDSPTSPANLRTAMKHNPPVIHPRRIQTIRGSFISMCALKTPEIAASQ